MSDSDQVESSQMPSFDDVEDNNPFSHTQGLTSMIEDSMSERENHEENGLEDSVLLYKSGKAPHNEDGSTAGGKDDGSTNVNSSTIDVDKFNRVHINYESRVTKLLKPHSKVKVQITEANNSNEGASNSSKKYIVYTIKLISIDNPDEEDIQTRRRYSDFESLRDVLTKIFPLVIVPPIPPKNYLNLNVLNGLVNGTANQHSNGGNSNPHHHGDVDSVAKGESPSAANSSNDNSLAAHASSNYYTYINSNHLNKHKLIEHRKRLLTNFLNNCLEIPKLRNLEFFAKFLDPNANWTDEIALISSQLPKSIYQSNPENGLQTDAIYASLPLPVSHSIPSFLKPLKRKVGAVGAAAATAGATASSRTTASAETNDNQSELSGSAEDISAASAGTPAANTSVTSEIIDSTQLDETNKKIMGNFIGLSNDYTDLGSIFNSLSLILAETSTSEKLKSLSTSPDEIKLNLIFDKIGQVFDRSYITLNSLIGDLETKFSEPLGEAVRFSGTLQTVRKFKERKNRQSNLLDTEVEDKKKEYNDLLTFEAESSRVEQSAGNGLTRNTKYALKDTASPPSANGTTGGGGSSGGYRMMPMFKKITRYVSDIIDQNPEETRKQKLISLQAKIEILERCQTRMLEDISYISDELNNNFQRFRRIQLKMIYDILLSYNGFLVEWARKNVEIWEEIKDEILRL
ncbi:sorting nexin-41 [[Candida] railenensis]|uniref:Sorting nexin-41 n=1 Tax=[Candida] railenensis TaxID=45579 RepID=A0A9P0QS26_9ASCO|nr:sorting nexin-41 [[Candida] railenensis]